MYNIIMALIIYGFPLIILSGLVFVIPAVIFFRKSKNKEPFKLGILFYITHFSFVFLMGIIYYLASPESSRYQFGLIVWIFDIPTTAILSSLVDFLEKFLTPRQFAEIEYLLFFAMHALLGSFQYFLVGLFVGWVYKKKHNIKAA